MSDKSLGWSTEETCRIAILMTTAEPYSSMAKRMQQNASPADVSILVNSQFPSGFVSHENADLPASFPLGQTNLAMVDWVEVAERINKLNELSFMREK